MALGTSNHVGKSGQGKIFCVTAGNKNASTNNSTLQTGVSYINLIIEANQFYTMKALPHLDFGRDGKVKPRQGEGRVNPSATPAGRSASRMFPFCAVGHFDLSEISESQRNQLPISKGD